MVVGFLETFILQPVDMQSQKSRASKLLFWKQGHRKLLWPLYSSSSDGVHITKLSIFADGCLLEEDSPQFLLALYKSTENTIEVQLLMTELSHFL